jgi:hypothetical protein
MGSFSVADPPHPSPTHRYDKCSACQCILVLSSPFLLVRQSKSSLLAPFLDLALALSRPSHCRAPFFVHSPNLGSCVTGQF